MSSKIRRKPTSPVPAPQKGDSHLHEERQASKELGMERILLPVTSAQLILLKEKEATGGQLQIVAGILEEIFPYPDSILNQATSVNSSPNDCPFSPQEVARTINSLPKGNIILFRKPEKPINEATSYRPISLLPTIGKVLEKLLTQRLTYHLEKNNHICNRQYGFHEGKSMDLAIDNLMREIKLAKQNKNHVLLLLIDIKGAFDNIQHAAIVDYLNNSNSPANLIEIFKDILKNRKVVLNTAEGPAEREQKQGCPQGSCSGPALWNLVANEILQQDWPRNTTIQAFADDFAITHAPTRKEIENQIHAAIEKFSKWANKNKLKNTTNNCDLQISQLEIDYKISGWTSHPSVHLEDHQISLDDGGLRSDPNGIYTDGSKTDKGVEAAYCVFNNGVTTTTWATKLAHHNTVFQAEILALYKAAEFLKSTSATSAIYVGNRSSILATKNPKTNNKCARRIFAILSKHANIKISWIKALDMQSCIAHDIPAPTQPKTNHSFSNPAKPAPHQSNRIQLAYSNATHCSLKIFNPDNYNSANISSTSSAQSPLPPHH
ncbi:uncharacterized protein LOC129962987 [Argiope bruennichi]|uniref:uncharacterized protein LOC129962987 n=1 Tax=Argiope bruennichi TaxID=94029 RepID=UPI0024954FC6|nr:uncharacterized protein LOC129962987 [Argiope bruennichi]